MIERRRAIDGQIVRADVAIIGAGFSGTMLAVQLLEQSHRKLTIALIDGNNAFGRGAAYGTDCPDHLLNVVASKMSAYDDRPSHFLEWLRSHPPVLAQLGLTSVEPGDFIPRSAYGRYLRSLLEQASAQSRHVRLLKIVAQVTDLEPTGNGYNLVVAGASSVFADRVVIATGNRPPSDVPILSDRFYRTERYVRNPWSRAAAGQMQRANDILILGSGLTALDAVMTARRSTRVRSITLLSRHGQMPIAHRTTKQYDGDLSDVLGDPSLPRVVRAVRSHIVRAAQDGHDWRSVIDALRASTPRIWQGFDLAEKRRFFRHVKAFWEPSRHRVAPAVQMEVAALESAGLVTRLRGRLSDIQELNERARVTYVERGSGALRHADVDLVVNCTGPTADIGSGADPLMTRVLARGLVRQDPLRLGLDHTSDGALIESDGIVSDRLFGLGTLRRGRLYESTAVPELRVQAAELGRLLMRTAKAGAHDLGADTLEERERAAVVI
jgi:uncharacterized NAD(P)/FAD-binding protein YdhS